MLYIGEIYLKRILQAMDVKQFSEPLQVHVEWYQHRGCVRLVTVYTIDTFILGDIHPLPNLCAFLSI